MVAPFHIPEPIEVTVDLPLPPSVNTIWRHVRGRVIRSVVYRDWITRADAVLMASPSAWRGRTIMGPCEVHLMFNVESGIGDGDNRIKAILDYCQRVELIDNDKLIMRGTWEWVKPAAAPAGVRVILRELAG